jgi:ADP-ribose pyrophosphatase YjhB (NUDIX family)
MEWRSYRGRARKGQGRHGVARRQPAVRYDGPTMEAIRHLAFCASCGTKAGSVGTDPGGPFRCAACGFTLFFNSASAVAAIIERTDGRALFIRRAKDPGQGKLGMPGGFVDAGESGEQALVREVKEEVGLDLKDVRYLSSHANRYFYAGVTYHTLDLFYTGRVDDPDAAAALDAVDAIAWIDPRTVPLDEIAFDSMKAALEVFRAGAFARG